MGLADGVVRFNVPLEQVISETFFGFLPSQSHGLVLKTATGRSAKTTAAVASDIGMVDGADLIRLGGALKGQ